MSKCSVTKLLRYLKNVLVVALRAQMAVEFQYDLGMREDYKGNNRNARQAMWKAKAQK